MNRTTPKTRLGRAVAAFFDPARHEMRTLVLLGLMLVGAAWMFFSVLEDVVTDDPLVLMDRAVWTAFRSFRGTADGDSAGDAFMIAVTELGDPVVVVAVAGVVLLWLASRRAWRAARYWIVAVAGASALNTAIKLGLHRARPNELLYSGWSAFSFPSGHSTVNLVLYGFLAFLVTRETRPERRFPIAFGAGALALLIGFSRLYLGAHWLSDVIGGVAFGCAWLALLGLLYLRRPAAKGSGAGGPGTRGLGGGGLLAVACAALILAGGLHIRSSHASDMERYAAATRLNEASLNGETSKNQDERAASSNPRSIDRTSPATTPP